MVNDCMLTTFDNPFNPFEQFEEWLLYDNEQGYNTCGKIDRIANVSDDMSQREEELEIERAIDEIVEFDPTNNYVKVTRENIQTILDKNLTPK